MFFKQIRFASFFIIVSCTLAQSQEIRWESEETLIWQNFQGPIDQSSDKAAKTYSGVKYEASILRSRDKIEIDLNVYAYFLTTESWSHLDKQRETLLKHEQVHFDISELHARLLRKAFAEYEYPKDFDENILDQIFEANSKARDSVQLTYDKDTNHSLFREGQALWEQFVADSITTFEAYSSPNVKVVIDLRD